MVNTGKPSGGCKLCRARRVKCDETKPACLKCLRAKRQCPGYRDPFESKIRDETQATIRKYKRTRIVIEKEQVLREEGLKEDEILGDVEKDEDDDNGDDDDDDNLKADVANWTSGYFDRRGGSKTPTSASSTTSFDSTHVHEDFLASLATPVEQRATCHLLADYVLVSDSPGGRRGYYKFVYKILTRPNGPSKSLLSAFKAVSFVALSSRPGASHLVVEAESHYAKALREVNKAIQDPSQVKSDDTLASVLLLAFYEVSLRKPTRTPPPSPSRRKVNGMDACPSFLTPRTQTLASTRERLDEYVSHIKGAAQLVKMRGPGINDTDEGAEMYSMTRNQVIAMRCMTPPTASDHEDYSWLLTEHCADAYVSRVATLTISCSEIRMKVDRALTGGRRDPRQIQTVLDLLRTAQAVSKKLSSLDQPQSAVWRVDRTGPQAVGEGGGAPPPPPGDVYNFHNLYVCMIYTIIWTSHLFLTTCIFRCMAWLVSPDRWQTGEEYELAVQATKRRIADIVASLPYACTWNGYNSDYGDFAVGATMADSPAKGVAGMCVYKPAFTALMSDYATPEQKKYLQGRLRFLADVVGIKQVNVLLNVRLSFRHIVC